MRIADCEIAGVSAPHGQMWYPQVGPCCREGIRRKDPERSDEYHDSQLRIHCSGPGMFPSGLPCPDGEWRPGHAITRLSVMTADFTTLSQQYPATFRKLLLHTAYSTSSTSAVNDIRTRSTGVLPAGTEAGAKARGGPRPSRSRDRGAESVHLSAGMTRPVTSREMGNDSPCRKAPLPRAADARSNGTCHGDVPTVSNGCALPRTARSSSDQRLNERLGFCYPTLHQPTYNDAKFRWRFL